MVIRKANYDDVETLNKFLTLLIQDERQYDSGINPNFVVTNMYENYIEDPSKLIIVAEEDNQILGYLYGIIKETDDTYKYVVAKLDALYVDSIHRNRGIATVFIGIFKQWAISKNVDIMEVNVNVNNVIAKALYKNLNFKTENERLIIKNIDNKNRD